VTMGQRNQRCRQAGAFRQGRLAAWVFALATLPPVFASAQISIINGDPGGVGLNDPTILIDKFGNKTTLGSQRLFAIRDAASVWQGTLTSSVQIKIRVTWTALPCDESSAILGSTAAAEVWKDFPNVPVAGHWYGKALADKLAGENLDLSSEDIDVTFNINLGKPGVSPGPSSTSAATTIMAITSI
jgi:hypothetical protein